ncbi:MAG: helix-turn-helix transcriptional regulator [Clostridia bacterium]|nr:helix-turn-helix transcriptional regulator [Clostridia bacterium]
MEKKTLGSLISALRRAAGMTQKDLAEKLNVSDKAVSRWERDESAPDLTLLPLIADLFDITVDELLRGQRRSATEASENTEQTEYKKEESNHRQKMLLANSKRKFKSFMFIPIGLEAAGLLVAMICNFGFYRAALGFLFGMTFIVAAVICSFVFTGNALPTNEDEYDTELIRQYKVDVLTYTYKVLFAAFIVMIPIVLIGLVWLHSGSSFVGLPINSFIIMTPLLAFTIGGIMHEIGKFAILPRMLEKYGISENEYEYARRKRIGKLARRCVLSFICSLLVPIIAFVAMQEMVDRRTAFTSGKTFDNFEDFKEYIETYKPQVSYYDNGVIVYEENYTVLENGEYVNEEGEQEEGIYCQVPALKEDGTKDNYNLLYTYYHRNGEVLLTEWSTVNKDRLPVTVYTVYDFAQSEAIHSAICVGLILIMVGEFITALVIYIKKRSKFLLCR